MSNNGSQGRKSQSFFKIAVVITFASVLGKIFGFLKDILISYHYGTTAMTDAFFLAMAIPTMIVGIFTASSDSAIIPQYERIIKNKNREFADQNISNVINILLIFATFMCVVIILWPNLIIDLFAPGFSDTQREYGVHFVRIFSFVGCSHILYCFFSAYNTRYQNVTMRAILSFSTNVIVIIAISINADEHMNTLVFAYLVGFVISAILPIISAYRLGYRHKWYVSVFDADFKAFLVNFLPIMGSAFVYDLNMFVDRFLCTSLKEGSLSALTYASKLTSMFDSMLVMGLGIAILPLFSKFVIKADFEGLKKVSQNMILLVTVLLVPLALVLIVLSTQVVQIVYQRGNFTMDSVVIVSGALAMYAPQVVTISLKSLMDRIFYAMERPDIPLKSSLIGVGFNICLSFILVKMWGLNGIAFATSIATFVSIVILVGYMKFTVGWDTKIFGLKECICICICSLITSTFLVYAKNMFESTIFTVIFVGFTGIILYYACIFIMLRKQLIPIFSSILKKNK